MNTVETPQGDRWPALGLGTWRLGEGRRTRAVEVGALRLAFDLGYRVVDTAEMYGEGGAEEVVGAAIADALRAGTLTRDELVVVSKVYPHNASADGVVAACERSLRRLGLDRLDLYLLHWRGSIPLDETIAGFQALQRRGLIGRWGVSNFDLDDLLELEALAGGRECAANQVYYSLGERGPEFELLPAQRERRMPLMAYCPIDQGALAGHKALAAVAARHRVSAAEVALAWVLSRPGVMAIPMSADAAHLQANWRSASLALDADDFAAIDRAFPPPRRRKPLAMR